MSLAEIEQHLLARWPETKLEPSLNRIACLLDLLGRPQTTYRSVHVTGTNGKTSTARMIEALLAATGVRTGRLTSPHLTDLRERISLDQRPIALSAFAEAYAAVAPKAAMVDAASPVPLSFFEMTVAMAYESFAAYGVQTAVVEVGMGGRWDATNVIDAEVAAILPISLDHTEYLGDTIVDIAAEKAGIIKPGSWAVVARQDPEVEQLLRAHADAVGARLAIQDRDFAVTARRPTRDGQMVSVMGLSRSYDDVPLSLHGRHQAQNAAVAIAAVEAVREAPIDPEIVRATLAHVSSPRRFEIRPGPPMTILDAAHNPHGAGALVGALADLGPGHTVAVVAVMGDKDFTGFLRRLEPVVDRIVCTQNTSGRCLPAHELAAYAREIFGAHRVQVYGEIGDALGAASAMVEDQGEAARVLVTGSVVTVGDATRLLSR